MDLIKKLIEKNPEKRITLEQCLLHEWLISTKVDNYNKNSQIKSDNNKFVKSIHIDEDTEEEEEENDEFNVGGDTADPTVSTTTDAAAHVNSTDI